MTKPSNRKIEYPVDVSEEVGLFDRFAGYASQVASRALFFCLCVTLVIVWLPSILLIRDVDTWQLVINTVTTIVTFLLVALLQNSQTRSDQAVQHKLNAIADALADFMEHSADESNNQHLKEDLIDLRKAVGLEARESTSHNATVAKS